MTHGFIAAAASLALLAQQQPKFSSAIDVTSIDVSVVDDHGRPIEHLTPSDFTVRVEGSPRKVVSAEWIPLTAPAKPAVPLPDGYSSNENATGGRLIMIAVDESNIGFGRGRGLTRAASAFVDHLGPLDRVGAIGFGVGTAAIGFTADRERVKQTLARMVGQKSNASTMTMTRNVSLSEALLIANNDAFTAGAVVDRECAGLRATALIMCRDEVLDVAHQLALDSRMGADAAIRGLQDVLISLKAIDGPKTLIVMSEGFVVDNTTTLMTDLGELAAAAHTSVYALQVDDLSFDVAVGRAPITPTTDRQRMNEGLEALAAASRGALFRLVGDPAGVFDRIQAELSGYYLLGVESDPRDRDGKSHAIRVDVAPRGAIVRARRQILAASPPGSPVVGTPGADASGAPDASRPPARSPREAVVAGLNAPLLMTSLPLRVATFSLQGPENGKVQLLIHAEIGTEYTAPARMSIGYMITDGRGNVVETQGTDARLVPTMSGVPSSLEYLAGASVPPGDYTLKLVVADGDKVGSIEHRIHAALVDAGALKLSELMVGGPLDAGNLLRPIVGYKITYGSVQGYVEVYGADAASVEATFEIAREPGSPALLSAEVPGRSGGEGRVLFTRVIPVHTLPPGVYVLRAVVTKAGQPVKTMARAFEVAGSTAAATPALGTESKDGELFLPTENVALAGPFRLDEALKPATVDPFRARLAPAGKDAFEKGLAFMAAHDYPKAERSFKAAVQPDVESTAPLAYLGVCFAAAGHDVEAASVWQTSLVDGSAFPQIYEWLADALMRNHDLGAARLVLEEATAAFPADVRFARPLAILYASFGRGRDAVRSLERYLGAADAGGSRDSEALALGVEWIYKVHAAGAAVHGRDQDLELARRYADEYAKAGGSKQQLVKQWLDALAK
jgi:VWFA-related protein